MRHNYWVNTDGAWSTVNTPKNVSNHTHTEMHAHTKTAFKITNQCIVGVWMRQPPYCLVQVDILQSHDHNAQQVEDDFKVKVSIHRYLWQHHMFGQNHHGGQGDQVRLTLFPCVTLHKEQQPIAFKKFKNIKVQSVFLASLLWSSQWFKFNSIQNQ